LRLLLNVQSARRHQSNSLASERGVVHRAVRGWRRPSPASSACLTTRSLVQHPIGSDPPELKARAEVAYQQALPILLQV
jgi:hypothetical protein